MKLSPFLSGQSDLFYWFLSGVGQVSLVYDIGILSGRDLLSFYSLSTLSVANRNRTVRAPSRCSFQYTLLSCCIIWRNGSDGPRPLAYPIHYQTRLDVSKWTALS